MIGLHPSTKKNDGGSGNVSIGFTSENIDDGKSLLEKSGIKFQLREEEGRQFVHFSDPDGTMLYFIKSKW